MSDQEPDNPTPASTGEPDATATQDDAETSKPKKVRSWFVGAAAFIVSTLAAAVISNYYDEWSSSGAIPGGPNLYAESQVWWDLTQDSRTVEMPHAVSLDKVYLYAPDPPSQLDALATNGGIPAGMMRIRLTLMDFSKSPVVVTGLNAKILGKKPTPSGTSFSCGGPQGGVDVTRVKMSLGSRDKIALEYDGDKLVGTYPMSQVQLAKQDEPAIFDIQVSAGKDYYTFAIEVHYVQGEKRGAILVDDAGKPFQLAPLNHANAYHCDSSNRWVR